MAETNLTFELPAGSIIIIGRRNPFREGEPTIDLAAVDHGQTVSHLHAELTDTEAGIFIRDLGSLNGVRVNHRRIPPDKPVKIHAGDSFQLGYVQIVMVEPRIFEATVERTGLGTLLMNYSDDRERPMDFILAEQARHAGRLEEHEIRMSEMDRRQAEFLESLIEFKDEMRTAFENLIVANEVTRDLTEQVARLAMQTSQRVSDLEGP
jgi:pSer/pThr/pTyr-binding forkhead associated (FHA) protein